MTKYVSEKSEKSRFDRSEVGLVPILFDWISDQNLAGKYWGHSSEIQKAHVSIRRNTSDVQIQKISCFSEHEVHEKELPQNQPEGPPRWSNEGECFAPLKGSKVTRWQNTCRKAQKVRFDRSEVGLESILFDRVFDQNLSKNDKNSLLK